MGVRKRRGLPSRANFPTSLPGCVEEQSHSRQLGGAPIPHTGRAVAPLQAIVPARAFRVQNPRIRCCPSLDQRCDYPTCADLEVCATGYATRLIGASVVAREVHNGLNVIGLREQVEEVELRDGVAGGQ